MDLYKENGTYADNWMNMIEPIAAEYPYMVIPGNHENFFNFTHYESRYNSVSETNPYYYRKLVLIFCHRHFIDIL